jgi:hypothetical protein
LNLNIIEYVIVFIFLHEAKLSTRVSYKIVEWRTSTVSSVLPLDPSPSSQYRDLQSSSLFERDGASRENGRTSGYSISCRNLWTRVLRDRKGVSDDGGAASLQK